MNLAASTAETESVGAAQVSNLGSVPTSSTEAPLSVPPGPLPGSVMLELLNAQRPTSSGSEGTVVESEIERKFFRGELFLVTT